MPFWNRKKCIWGKKWTNLWSRFIGFVSVWSELVKRPFWPEIVFTPGESAGSLPLVRTKYSVSCFCLCPLQGGHRTRVSIHSNSSDVKTPLESERDGCLSHFHSLCVCLTSTVCVSAEEMQNLQFEHQPPSVCLMTCFVSETLKRHRAVC